MSNPARRRDMPVTSPLGHGRLTLFNQLILIRTYFFLRDKLPISMKMLVFFLAKCVRNAVKTMVVDRKNQKALALLYLASKPLRKAANSSGVPTEFEQNRRTFRLNFIAEFLSPRLSFSPSTKQTTECSSELFFFH